MSVVTEVVLIVYPTTEIEVEQILGHEFGNMRDGAAPQFLQRLDSRAAGGSKYASWDVFQAAFNYVSTNSIIDFFNDFFVGREQSGTTPAPRVPPLLSMCAVIMIDDENDDPVVLRNDSVEDRTGREPNCVGCGHRKDSHVFGRDRCNTLGCFCRSYA